MKTLKFDDQESWLAGRRGKITGTRLKDIISKRAGTGKKKGYYELIAERIAIEADAENPMERGLRLEEEAVAKFQEATGKTVDTSLVIWQREDCESIAISPDGFIGDTEAVEIKCLSSASHIEAWLTKEVPSEYVDQVIQYFCVNDKLETVYSVFYDPRIPVKDYFVIETHRKDVQEKVEAYLAYQKDTIAEINAIVNELTF